MACELVVTVDSSSIQTPIIGLVTSDVFYQGDLILPAGTEVHGNAQVDRARERISSDGRWTIVWQNGEQLSVSGIALDREPDNEIGGWGINDGSAGLRGRLIKSDNLAEIKLFAASLLSGAAEATTVTERTAFGSVAAPVLQNAPVEGAQRVLDRYADQVMRTIERDGFYVRVPAGKEFYLYITQAFDGADALHSLAPSEIPPHVAACDCSRTGAVPSFARCIVALPKHHHSHPSPMKTSIAIFAIILMPACSALPKKHANQPPTPQATPRNLLETRTPERVTTYRFGRYVDSTDRRVMHESHPVFRVEQDAGWNLTVPGTISRTPDNARVSKNAQRDVAVAERNQRQALSKALAEQSRAVTAQMEQSQAIAQNAKLLIEQNARLQTELRDTRNRLKLLETEPSASPAPTPQTTGTDATW